MKKIIYITLILPFLSLSQDFNYGVKLGANYSGFHSTSSAFTSNFGPQIGGFVSVPFNNDKFTLRGEILYSTKGGEFTELVGTNNVNVFKFDYKLNYIDIPIVIEYKFIKSISFLGGFQAGFLLNENLEINGSEVSEDTANGFDFGLVGGFVIDLSKTLFIEAKYNYGLSKVLDERDEKNSTISLSLGYLIK